MRKVWIVLEGTFNLKFANNTVQTVRTSEWDKDEATKSFGTSKMEEFCAWKGRTVKYVPLEVMQLQIHMVLQNS